MRGSVGERIYEDARGTLRRKLANFSRLQCLHLPNFNFCCSVRIFDIWRSDIPIVTSSMWWWSIGFRELQVIHTSCQNQHETERIRDTCIVELDLWFRGAGDS